jgi:NTP pyrophosphatase (non-canonical NTP hydrolase)
MNFKEYQAKALTFGKYPNSLEILYPALGLAGETGEVCEKIKKVYRDNYGEFTEEHITEITKELGDVLWYISQLATDLGIQLQTVAKTNIDKLESRLERNTINGNGDNR